MRQATTPQQGGPQLLPLTLQRLGYSAAGKTLLSDISLTFQAGRRTVVLGPNGAGKSLLLRLCHGLLQPSSGGLRWAIDNASMVRRQQAMAFQRPVLLRRSVVANVSYALAMQGVPRRNRHRLALEALRQVGLADLAKRQARVLSGGEQQRLALARAWALRPQVLFLDEPTANLDPGATRLIESIVQAIYENGTTTVMTTHDLGQARRNADEVVFLHRGRLLEFTPASTFFAEPCSDQARAFLAGELLN